MSQVADHPREMWIFVTMHLSVVHIQSVSILPSALSVCAIAGPAGRIRLEAVPIFKCFFLFSGRCFCVDFDADVSPSGTKERTRVEPTRV